MNDIAKDNHKSGRGQVINFVRDSYLDRTSRPVYALAYLLLFIVIYEIGTILISPEALNRSHEILGRSEGRVVSFIWLQNILEYIGFSQRFVWAAPPLAVVLILLGLQISSRTPWKVYLADFIPMTVECILLAVPLIVLCLAINRSVNPHAVITSAAAETASSGFWVNIVTGIGAGIYEELVFRLVLICILMMLFQDLLNLDRTLSVVLSILISAVLFSLHHHFFFLNGSLHSGEAFSFMKFTFRLLAGIYFAVLFAVRGFGIAAGTHAYYDIIAAILNAIFYNN